MAVFDTDLSGNLWPKMEVEHGRLVFLVLTGLHDLSVTLAAPAILVLVTEVHERCFGELPPSSLFAAGATAQGVTAATVSPVLCARLDRVSPRAGLLCCAVADGVVCLIWCCLSLMNKSSGGGSLGYFPVLAAQAFAGCTSGCKHTALEIYKYNVAQASADDAARLTSNRMTIEAISSVIVIVVLSAVEMQGMIIGLALLLELIFIYVILSAGNGLGLKTSTQKPTSTIASASPAEIAGWDALREAFVAVWRIPLERVHIIGTFACIGAAPNLQRKMQFGKQTQGTPAHLATMTSLGKFT